MRKPVNFMPSGKLPSVKSQLKSMLVASRVEFEKSKNLSLSFEDRRTFFQQACEKLYKAMIHILEVKSGYDIEFHEQLYNDDIWKRAGLNLSVMTNTMSDMNGLHNYFYEGQDYLPETVMRVYKRTYEMALRMAS